MKFNYKNLIYFQNGSIGDFLMTIFFLENIYLNNPKLNLYVVVPKNRKFLKGFLEKYPFIKILLVNKKTFRGLSGILQLFQFYFSANLVLTAPTPGSLSAFVKLVAKTIASMPSSKLIGFKDKGSFGFLYDELFEYNTKLLYPDFLKTIIKKIGFEVKKETPIFDFVRDDKVLKKNNLEKENYIVISPLAATQGRSLNKEELQFILGEIRRRNKAKIVLIGAKKDKNLDKFDDALILKGLRVKELSNLLVNCKLFIGVDTGTSHLASFLAKESLILAKKGTPNWLPYYNKKATILYKIEDCPHSIHEGRNHLEACRGEKLRCLESISLEVIGKYLNEKIG